MLAVAHEKELREFFAVPLRTPSAFRREAAGEDAPTLQARGASLLRTRSSAGSACQ
jgi:hypothetical protein